MKLKRWTLFAGILAMFAWSLAGSADDPKPAGTAWKLKADIVEASTDTVFCGCYDPLAKDRERHRCRFVTFMKIQQGSFGEVKLDGMKFALAGDLGRDLSGMSLSTLIIVTENEASKAQKEALERLIRELYPLRWTKKVSMSGMIDLACDADGARGILGNMGTVNLTTSKDVNGNPIVRRGLTWWNSKSNSGFTLAAGSLTFSGGGESFSQPSCTGFTTHIEAEGQAPGPP